MRTLLLAALLPLCTLSTATAAGTSYTTTHTAGADDWEVCFPAPQNDAFYTESFLALKIESVYADGVAITGIPHESGIRWHTEGRVFRPILPTSMLYRLNRIQFYSVVSVTKGGLTLVRYDVPPDSRKLEISYRVRFPSGKLSREFNLTSISYSDFKEIKD